MRIEIPGLKALVPRPFVPRANGGRSPRLKMEKAIANSAPPKDAMRLPLRASLANAKPGLVKLLRGDALRTGLNGRLRRAKKAAHGLHKRHARRFGKAVIVHGPEKTFGLPLQLVSPQVKASVCTWIALLLA